MKNFEVNYRKLVRASGIYDLIVTFPFAVPGLVSIQLATMMKVSEGLSLSGQFPVFEPAHLFFLNLFGSIVTIWSVLRILKPEPMFGLVDGIGRMVFSSLMVYYLVVWSIPQIIVLFLVPEILFGITQLYGYWLYRQIVK